VRVLKGSLPFSQWSGCFSQVAWRPRSQSVFSLLARRMVEVLVLVRVTCLGLEFSGKSPASQEWLNAGISAPEVAVRLAGFEGVPG
jgi:hypothetical protein